MQEIRRKKNCEFSNERQAHVVFSNLISKSLFDLTFIYYIFSSVYLHFVLFPQSMWARFILI